MPCIEEYFVILFSKFLATLSQSSGDGIFLKEGRCRRWGFEDLPNLLNFFRSNDSLRKRKRQPEKYLEAWHWKHRRKGVQKRGSSLGTDFLSLFKEDER